MDSVIISAIITALASAIVGIIGFRSSRNASIPALREIRFQQLTKIFEPIEQMIISIDHSGSDDCRESIIAIWQLLVDNLKLAPTFLYAEACRLVSMPYIAPEFIDKLRKMNSSLYHWHCKYFGYPYDPSKIIREYVPTYNLYLFLRFRAIRLIAVVIPFLLILLSVLVDFPEGEERTTALCVYCLCALCITLLFVGLTLIDEK